MISLVKLTTSKPGSIWSLWRNGLDTYMSREVPVSEGDEAQSPTQEELGQGQEDHGWFSHGSTCTTSVFLKDTKDVLIPWPRYLKGRTEIRIWPQETSWRMWRSRMQRPCNHKSLSNQEQLESVKEEVKNAEVVMATLNGRPGSCDSFMRGICARRKWLLSADFG